MNGYAINAIFRLEIARFWRARIGAFLSPLLTTSLYFVIFGTAIGDRVGAIGGVNYGAFIIPGLLMLELVGGSLSATSFGAYLPKWSGTIYEILSAPVTYMEIVIGFVGAAIAKTLVVALLVLGTARFFTPFDIAHPLVLAGFLILTPMTFGLLGFIIGISSDDFQKLQILPLMVVTPLTFLGGAFYTIDMLPSPWREITMLNPLMYLISGLRWSLFGTSEVNVAISASIIVGFLLACLLVVRWIFKSGWKLKS